MYLKLPTDTNVIHFNCHFHQSCGINTRECFASSCTPVRHAGRFDCLMTSLILIVVDNGPLARFVKVMVAHAPGMPGKFSPPPLGSNPSIHHGTCVTHVPWCMPGTLLSGFLWSRWRGKRSRHSWRRISGVFSGTGIIMWLSQLTNEVILGPLLLTWINSSWISYCIYGRNGSIPNQNKSQPFTYFLGYIMNKFNHIWS